MSHQAFLSPNGIALVAEHCLYCLTPPDIPAKATLVTRASFIWNSFHCKYCDSSTMMMMMMMMIYLPNDVWLVCVVDFNFFGVFATNYSPRKLSFRLALTRVITIMQINFVLFCFFLEEGFISDWNVTCNSIFLLYCDGTGVVEETSLSSVLFERMRNGLRRNSPTKSYLDVKMFTFKRARCLVNEYLTFHVPRTTLGTRRGGCAFYYKGQTSFRFFSLVCVETESWRTDPMQQ